MQIKPIEERNQDTLNRLIEIWRSAVVKTHTFLSEVDIAAIEPIVKLGLEGVKNLIGFYADSNTLQGFIGVENKKIEMLFIDAAYRGRGAGKQLVNYAVTHLDAEYVDVNEQNEQGVGFYFHMGFQLISRSELDEQGRPFPILHLKL